MAIGMQMIRFIRGLDHSKGIKMRTILVVVFFVNILWVNSVAQSTHSKKNNQLPNKFLVVLGIAIDL